MSNTSKSNRGNLLLRRMTGATAASLAVAISFTLIGYGDVGPDISQFLRELVIALASYVPIALFFHWATRSENIWWDIACLSLFGSTISFPMKLVFLEGQNGIPAYWARIARENSWHPVIDLVSHGTGFIIIATVLTLPVVASTVWLCQVLAKARWRKPAVE